jgi:hypothetical protein
MSVQLATLSLPQAKLAGFKSRLLRPEPTQRHLYAPEWRQHDLTPPEAGGRVFVVSRGDVKLTGRKNSGAKKPLMRQQQPGDVTQPDVAAIVSVHCGDVSLEALAALEMILTIVQSQAAMSHTTPSVRLLTPGAQLEPYTLNPPLAAVWGLARSGRAEVGLPLQCIDGSVATSLGVALPNSDTEAALRPGRLLLLPRLRAYQGVQHSNMRLNFHARGALSNLFIESQPDLKRLDEDEVLLHVRAVGLNFRELDLWDPNP